MTYWKAVNLVYEALRKLDEKKQISYVINSLEGVTNVAILPMESFDSFCKYKFGNGYSDFFDVVKSTVELGHFKFSDKWWIWDGNERVFRSGEIPADFVRNTMTLFDLIISCDEYLVELGFTKMQMTELRKAALDAPEK